jgi:hypothetical protein
MMTNPTPVSSPPVSDRPPEPRVLDSRDRLNQLAHALAVSRDARLLTEYLRLRTAVR